MKHLILALIVIIALPSSSFAFSREFDGVPGPALGYGGGSLLFSFNDYIFPLPLLFVPPSALYTPVTGKLVIRGELDLGLKGVASTGLNISKAFFRDSFSIGVGANYSLYKNDENDIWGVGRLHKAGGFGAKIFIRNHLTNLALFGPYEIGYDSRLGWIIVF